MNKNIFQLDEPRILVEQLFLILRNERSTLVLDLGLPALLLWYLSGESNAPGLRVWFVSVFSMKLILYFVARHFLATKIEERQAHKLARTLIVLQALFGATWGALAWAALDANEIMKSLLVLAVLAGVLGSAVSQISSVVSILLAFALAMLVAMGTRIMTMHNDTFSLLGALSVMYVGYMFLHALNSYRTVRSVIELRFENSALLDQLRIEKKIAEDALREAEHANAAKSKFLAAASHDLRQPIHAQGLFLEVLARTEQTPHQKALLASARAASEASSDLLNALLDFSRIEAGVVRPQIQSFRLQPLLNKIETELAPQADAKNIVYRSRESRLAVQSDPMLLEMILRNLVSNAIRYTEHGGLLIACRLRGREVVVEVWDTGIGIAPEHQQDVFREFHQLGNPERDRHKGLGLGLAIVDGLVRKLEHGLSLYSVPGRGSVFRISLPAATTIAEEQHPMQQSRTRVLNARLLVIDDDEIVRKGMLHLLRDWGCECDAAESIEEAQALVQLRTPDVIISDYRLREQRTGVEAIETIRKQLGADVPALLITGDTATQRLREAQASGIPLLHKPVSPSLLYRKLVELQQKSTCETT